MVSVELREYMEALIRHEHAMSEERFRAGNAAGEIQRAELARRLDDLNHAHAQAMADWAKYLPREIYEQHAAAQSVWQRGVDQSLATMRAWGAAGLLAVTVLTTAVTVLVGLLR